ncbi:MAG: hypothetical protein ACLQG3_05565 [Terracidiphilus sp.]
MKIIFRCCLFLASAALFAADSDTLTGTWKVHNSIAGNESDQNCAFTQKGEDLTGTCKSDASTVDVIGKVKGEDVTWQYKAEWDGNNLILVYTGKLKDSKIEGTVEVQPMGVTGDFTATPAK